MPADGRADRQPSVDPSLITLRSLEGRDVADVGDDEQVVHHEAEGRERLDEERAAEPAVFGPGR